MTCRAKSARPFRASSCGRPPAWKMPWMIAAAGLLGPSPNYRAVAIAPHLPRWRDQLDPMLLLRLGPPAAAGGLTCSAVRADQATPR
jgi:hypothetical protein